MHTCAYLILYDIMMMIIRTMMITCDNLWFGVDTHIIDGDNDYDRTIFYSVSSDRDDDFDEWDYH